MDKNEMLDIIVGNFTVDNLALIKSRLFRLFWCAPYEDTFLETCNFFWNVLLELREFAASRYGIEFSAINLNWDVNQTNFADVENRIHEESLVEIEKCKLQSIGMNFLSLISDKYGDRLLPSYFLRDEFNGLIKCLKEEKIDYKNFELQYKLNESFLPNIYELKGPVSSKKKSKLIKTLEIASNLAFKKGLISKQMVKDLQQSTLEKQLMKGSFTNEELAEKADKIFCFIKLTNQTEGLNQTPRPYTIEYLRDSQINIQLPAEQIYRIDASKSETSYIDVFCLHYKRIFKKLMEKFIQENKNKFNDEITSDILNNLNYIRIHRLNENIFLETNHEIFKTLTDYVLESKQTNKPFILHGASGSGKTTLISKFASNLYLQLKILQNQNNENRHVIITRFIGVDKKSTMLAPLLKSICDQIYYIKVNIQDEKNFPRVPNNFRDLKIYFKQCLTSCFDKSGGKLIVLIDSLDGLISDYSVKKLDWIPNNLHPSCKLILSVANEAIDLITKLGNKLSKNSSTFLEITGVSVDYMRAAVQKYLNIRNFRLSNDRFERISNLANENSIVSLHLQLFLEYFLTAAPDDEVSLHASFSFTINRWLEALENKFGALIVKHILSYITIAHSGLSENELQDILSLDNKVLSFYLSNDLIKHNGVFLRMPWFFILPLLNSLSSYLIAKPSNGFNTLTWKHNVLKKFIYSKYLKEDRDFEIYLNQNIAEYYMGKWSNRGFKQINFEKILEIDKKDKNKLTSDKPIIRTCFFNFDRLVPSQPTVYEDFHTYIRPKYNLRKLTQLPYHLIKANMIQELYAQVFYNLDWINSKLSAFDFYHLIYDYDLFNDTEVNLIRECLKWAQKDISKDSTAWMTLLTGHLLPYYNIYPNIRRLVDQLDHRANSKNYLIPISPIYKSPNWFYGDYIDLELDMEDKLEIDLVESEFNGRLLIAKNNNSTRANIFNLDLMEQVISITTEKGSVFCSRGGDFLCTFETKGFLNIKRIENGETHGTVELNTKSKVNNVFMSKNFALISLLNTKSPILVDLKSIVCKFFSYYASYACISIDEKALVIYSESSLLYHSCGNNHQDPSAFQLKMAINEIEEIPEKVLFFNNNLDLLVMYKNTKQVFHIQLDVKRKVSTKNFLVQEPGVVDLKISPDESILIVCSLHCIYVFHSSSTSLKNVALKFKLLSSQTIHHLNCDGSTFQPSDQAENLLCFTGFGISDNNRIIFATIDSSIICYNAQDGSIVRSFQSGLPPYFVAKTITNSSNRVVSILKHPKSLLLLWNLSWLEHGDLVFRQDLKLAQNMKIFPQSVDKCLLPKIEHNSRSNLNIGLAFSKNVVHSKILDLKHGLSVKSTLEILPPSSECDGANFELIQTGVDSSGRFCYLEYNLDEFAEKMLPNEHNFLKKQCTIIDLASENLIIDSFVYIIRKQPSSFRILHKFIRHQDKTYLVIRVSSCLKDFDSSWSGNTLDWSEFETNLKIYGPLEQSSSGVSLLVDEIKLFGEPIETELIITNTNVFASLMHKNSQLNEQTSPNWPKPKHYATSLNILKLFESKDNARNQLQLCSLNELLTDDEQSSKNVFLDVRIISNDFFLIIYSKEGTANKVNNSFSYNYEALKFERNFRVKKAALIYDPCSDQVLRRLSNVLGDETNTEELLLANYLVLDQNWTLFDLKNDNPLNSSKTLKDFKLNWNMAKYVLDGDYLISCLEEEPSELVLVRTRDVFRMTSFNVYDQISLIEEGEQARTILVGTKSGCLYAFKLVVDLENEMYLDKYVKFYRKKSNSYERKSMKARRKTEAVSEKNQAASELFDNRLSKKIMLQTEVTNKSRLSLFRDECSPSQISNYSALSDKSSANFHCGIAKMNLKTITDGIKHSKNHSRACLLQ